ncbi:MAG: glycoside hydrolase family 75 protein [Myxococcales bacterium]|nr:glycoside hydrolase family 75 protein [Myxococcales bacterium]
MKLSHLSRAVVSVLSVALFGAMPSCAEEAEFMETEAAAELDADSITATYPSGSIARTLNTANFRRCAAVSNSCAPYGQLAARTTVTLVTGRPSNGFYEVATSAPVGGESRGWVHGNLLTIVSLGTPMTMPGGSSALASAVLDRTQSCAPLSGAPRYAKDSGGTRNVPICQSGSAIWFRADMDIDCDGGSSAQCRSDPYYQSQTSGTSSTGRPLDASTLSFVVIPLDTDGFSFSARNVKMGTVAAIVYAGRIVYGIVGDAGPRGVIGEASAKTAELLGINASPISGGVESGVTYVVFPGVRVTRNEDAAEARTLAERAVNSWLGR